jgi:dihydrofolate reductase
MSAPILLELQQREQEILAYRESDGDGSGTRRGNGEACCGKTTSEQAVKASVYIATSLDGFIARENGDLDWLPSGGGGENGEDYGYKAFMDTVDVLVMGRNTYEKVLTFGDWPYGTKPVVVLSSRSLPIPEHITRSVESISCPPAELVSRLAARGARHLYIDGGKTIQGFLNAGLIQRIIITRIPVLIGSGISLFGPLQRDIKLRHIETRQFSSGLVQGEYEVATAPCRDLWVGTQIQYMQ